MGVDSAFLKKENKVLGMKVKCSSCGSVIRVFINDMSSAGEVWPFCGNCGTYVDVVPGD
jgi:transcription elongation factor Elf1